MNRKMVRGIIVLIALVGIAGVFLLISHKTDTEPKTVYNLPSDEVMQKVRGDLAAQDAPKPTPNGHQHADGTWHEGEHEPVTQPAPVQTYNGPLTFHEELLKINPAEALYKQSLERGHWSSKWIPPFRPEDTEAQEFARSLYLREYYENIDDKKNPIYVQAGNEIWYKLDDIHDMPADARSFDLLKLTWVRVPAGSVVVDWSDPSNFSLPRTDR